MRKYFIFSSTYVLIVFTSMLFSLVACTEQDTITQHGTGSIAPSIVWVSRTEQSRQLSIQSSPQQQVSAARLPSAALPIAVQPSAIQIGPGTTLPSDLKTFRLIITGSGITNAISKDFPAADRSGTLTGIPVGSNRTVTAQGLNSSNNVVYEGVQENVSVTTGTTTPVSITAIELIDNTADNTAPSAIITFPPAASTTEGNSIIVRGTATDASEITVVRVNGIDAITSDNFATWKVTVALTDGINNLTVETGDIALNTNIAATSVQITTHGPVLIQPSSAVIDSANNRALVTDDARDALMAVDLTSGARTILSDNNSPNSVISFFSPEGIAIDIDNNRALILDFRLDDFSFDSFGDMVAVNLTSGTRTIFSNDSIPNAVNIFDFPLGVVLDSANNRALVIDSGLDALVAVDLSSGARTIISDDNIPNATNAFIFPAGVTLDSANNRALVIDDGLKALVAVDLANGERTLLSNSNPLEEINALDFVSGVVLDSANNRALVSGDFQHGALVAVGLISGARTTFSSSSTPNAVNTFNRPGVVALDKINNRALVIDDGLDALVAVDLTSGARTILSDDSIPNAINPFSSPRGVAIDSANNRALVTDSSLEALVAVDLTSGARTILSNKSTPNDVNVFDIPFSVVLDSDNNRALVTDLDLDAIVAVDLTNGARTILSDNSTPDAVNSFKNPLDMVLDSANNRALVLDFTFDFFGDSFGVLMAVDLTSGVRTIISSSTVGGLHAFVNPSRVALDSANNRALVTDAGLDALVAVDLTSGVRTILSDDNSPDAANALFSPAGIVIDSNNNRALVTDTTLDAIIMVDLINGQRVRFSR